MSHVRYLSGDEVREMTNIDMDIDNSFFTIQRRAHNRQLRRRCCCDSPATLLLSSVIQVEEVCDRGRVTPQI